MELKSKIESILFVSGEPVSLKRLISVLGASEDEIRNAVAGLKEEYKIRGLAIMEKDGEWQMGTNPVNAELIEKLIKSDFTEDLTRAALETLTIIAYKGPMTRSEVEFVRGVNSSFTVRNLLMRGLVERIENPKDARSYLYKISFDFLKHLGISSVSEIPSYEEMRIRAEEVLGQGMEMGEKVKSDVVTEGLKTQKSS